MTASPPSLLTAAIAARAVIVEDRKVWFESNVMPTTGKVPDDAAICLDHYDATLALLDAAIAAAGESPIECIRAIRTAR